MSTSTRNNLHVI